MKRKKKEVEKEEKGEERKEEKTVAGAKSKAQSLRAVQRGRPLLPLTLSFPPAAS